MIVGGVAGDEFQAINDGDAAIIGGKAADELANIGPIAGNMSSKVAAA